MKVCITGALGHIGSHLIRNLSDLSLEKVHLVDNLETQRYSSLFDLPADIPCRFHQLDILSEEMDAVLKDSDCVIHLAAITDAEESFHAPDAVDKVNRKGLEHIAALCLKNNCSLIFPSTTSVYGKQTHLVDETCQEKDLKPQSPYAESKLSCEKFLKKLGEEKNFPFTILRIGTIFGYSIGMRFHTAVNKFTWQAVMGKELSIWKTAYNQKRPYCGLGDCVNAMKHILRENIFDQEIYNIVSVNLTVKDIVETLRQFIPDLKETFVDSPIMNQLSYEVCNKKSLARGFQYQDDLNKSKREVIDHLQNANAITRKNMQKA